MSVVYKCFLALVLAAGGAGSASAVTWKMDFFDDSNVLVGTGTFTTAGVPTEDSLPMAASNWIAVVEGNTYLTYQSIPQLEFFQDQFVTSFLTMEKGGSIPLDSLLGVSKFESDSLGNATLVRRWIISYSCKPTDPSCPTPYGTFTLNQVPGVDPAPSVVPLPASAALLPLGLGALALVRRRRRSQP